MHCLPPGTDDVVMPLNATKKIMQTAIIKQQIYTQQMHNTVSRYTDIVMVRQEI